MKGFLKSILILTMILCFAISAFAVKILPYNMPLHDIMSWDERSATLKIANPEGESVSVAWASTVDLWNYDGTTWKFDLPIGSTFAFGKGVRIGAPSSTYGSGLRIGTAYVAAGAPVGIYFDDGGVAVTSWGEGFTVGTVYTAASTAQGQTGMPYTAFFYNDVQAAMNGAASCGWSAVMMNFAMTGALAGFEVGVSSLHTSVDLNATSSLSEETTLSCISFGGNWIAGTYDASTDGLIVPLNVRSTNQNWSAFLHLPASPDGCYVAYNAAGNGAYSIKVYVGTTPTYIHTYDAP